MSFLQYLSWKLFPHKPVKSRTAYAFMAAEKTHAISFYAKFHAIYIIEKYTRAGIFNGKYQRTWDLGLFYIDFY